MDGGADPARTCEDRRVEITGPVDRKMVINALNSGANVFMADFEDSNSPTWQQQHRRPDQPARRRQRRRSAFASPEGKQLQAERRRSRRCWCGRAAGTWWRSTSWSTASRSPARCSISACTSSTTPQTLIANGHRPVLLSAEDGEPPRSAAVERRLHLRAGLRRRAARDHPRHGADRDDSRPPSRWTRSSTSCATIRPG